MSDALLFVLLSLACFRIYRFIGRDDLTEPVRRFFTSNDDGFFHLLITCPWCVSVYIAAALTFVVDRFFVAMPLPVLQWGAVCAVVGLLGEIDLRLSK